MNKFIQVVFILSSLQWATGINTKREDGKYDYEDENALTILKMNSKMSEPIKEIDYTDDDDTNQTSNDDFIKTVLDDLAKRTKEILSKKKNLKLPITETNDTLTTIINKLAAYPKLDLVNSYYEEHEVAPGLQWIGQIAGKVQSSKVADAAVPCGSYLINPRNKTYFQSPEYPRNYPRKYRCEWNFKCASETSTMEINCDYNFELQKNPTCYTDYIEAFDKSGPIRRYCGRDAPKKLISSTNFIGILFRTNWDKITRAGFSCNIICNDFAPRNPRSLMGELAKDPKLEKDVIHSEEKEVLEQIGQVLSEVHAPKVTRTEAVECGLHLIYPGEKIFFKSPKYPNIYPKNYRCVWKFNCSSENAVMELNCDDYFELQKNPICSTDYIETFDKSGSIKKNCGKDAPKGLTSISNFMRVVFRSNGDKIRRAGFSCNVMCSSIATTTIKPVENKVHTTTEAEPPATKVEPPTTEADHPPADAGRQTTKAVIPTTAAENPTTDNNQPTAEAPSPPVPCGKYDIDPSETVYLESVNYPDKYNNNDTCRWRFTCSDISSMIEVDCPNFYIESDPDCLKDYVKVKDESSKLGTFCGRSGPSNLVSYSNVLKFIFVSDLEKNKTGFRCSVRCTSI